MIRVVFGTALAPGSHEEALDAFQRARLPLNLAPAAHWQSRARLCSVSRQLLRIPPCFSGRALRPGPPDRRLHASFGARGLV